MDQATSPTTTSLIWQAPKQLHAHDKVWFLTGIRRELSPFKPWSKPQELFKVGAYDLITGKIGFVRFGRDIAYALMKVCLPPPPWKAPAPFAVELHREGHVDDEEKGRFLTWATRIELDPTLLSLAPAALRKFAEHGHSPNANVGMWAKEEARAAKENAVEQAALSMVGVFKASDVKAIVGGINVSPILKRLVEEGRLVPASPKTYRVAPPKVIIIERSDWTS